MSDLAILSMMSPFALRVIYLHRENPLVYQIYVGCVVMLVLAIVAKVFFDDAMGKQNPAFANTEDKKSAEDTDYVVPISPCTVVCVFAVISYAAYEAYFVYDKGAVVCVAWAVYIVWTTPIAHLVVRLCKDISLM